MTKGLLLLSLLTFGFTKTSPDKYITKQGQVTFFSYTTVENIEATNNQVLSILDAQTGDIAVSMLMRAFSFKKALMQEHFNESYIESDLFPKATFEGQVLNLDPMDESIQTKIIKGVFTLRDRSKEIEIKAQIARQKGSYVISGETELSVDDFDIKIPPILSPNIAKTIKVSFNFQYEPYEN